MTIFLILAPYGAFALLMLVTSATVSLLASAVDLPRRRSRSMPCAAARSRYSAQARRSLFAGSAGYVTLVDPGLSIAAVKLAVDTGIFLISAISMLLRYPFTLQYALEAVPAETAAMPGFLRANYIITGAWTVASLLMMIANVAMLYVPGLPIWSSLVIAFAARNSAVYFTKWYPEYRKAKYATHALPGT